jgi:pre-mRNA-splicing factor 18
MDFASLMKAQISKGKSSTPTNSTQKYQKRSEIEAQREANYIKEQEELDRARAERLAKKRKLDEDEAERNREREEKKLRLAQEARRQRARDEEREERERRKRLGLPDLPDKKEGTPLADGEQDIEEVELAGKLRELGQPRRLFGETHAQTLRRYRKLVEARLAPKMHDGPIPTILEPVEEKDMKVPLKSPKDAEGKKYVFRQLASYFTMLLTEWEIAMARRPQEVKESYTGKLAHKAMTEARSNLIPFFRKMEKADIEDTVLDGVLEIVHAAQERRYVDANDGYLRLSIGKAAWPIGVTMVGIHERSAREKLHESDNTAHIMSDETTRKYLQGIKRCLSFAQTRWPPDDQLQLMG